MYEPTVQEAVQEIVLQFLQRDRIGGTRGHLITVLHADHPPNEQWPVAIRNVQENDLDCFLRPLQNRIVRFRNDVATQPGNPYWYCLRREEEPTDTFDQIYHRDANGGLYVAGGHH